MRNPEFTHIAVKHKTKILFDKAINKKINKWTADEYLTYLLALDAPVTKKKNEVKKNEDKL